MGRQALLVTTLVALSAGCGVSASPDPGIEAALRLTAASADDAPPQFVPGPMPTGGSDGPLVSAVQIINGRVHPGQVGKPLAGRAGLGGVALAMGIRDDVGYWVFPVGVEDPQFPGEFNFAVNAAFSRGLAPGKHQLVTHAVDKQGRFGPASDTELDVVQAVQIAGDLVITLLWDGNSDLDLHVLPPNGVEVWSRKTTSYQRPPPPQFPDDKEIAASGYLDYDSNSQCAIDGRRMENVIWRTSAPSGRYQVRVDAYSMCGEPAAPFRVQAFLGVDPTSNPIVLDAVANRVVTDAAADPKGPKAAPFVRAEGLALDSDTRFPHKAGAGVLALDFTLE